MGELSWCKEGTVPEVGLHHLLPFCGLEDGLMEAVLREFSLKELHGDMARLTVREKDSDGRLSSWIFNR